MKRAVDYQTVNNARIEELEEILLFDIASRAKMTPATRKVLEKHQAEFRRRKRIILPQSIISHA